MDLWRRGVEWGRQHLLAVDAAAAVVLAVIAVPAQWQTPPNSEGITFRDPDVLGALLLVMSALPIAWRRRAPLVVLALTGVSAFGYEILGYATSIAPVGLLVTLYTVGAHCDRRRSRIAALLTAIGLALVLVLARWDVTIGSIISNAVVFGTAWLLGDNVQTRRAYVASLRERAETAEQTRAAEAQRAVAEERNRIARELHDVVAHSMSVMVVQAGAARRIVDRDPDQATEAIGAIEATGRQALTEMRRLLGVLRDDGAAAMAPQPSLGGLEDLVDEVREAGLTVSIEVEGEARPLPAGIDLSAYRIVQEALTNALKHGGPETQVRIVIAYGDDEVSVEVLDDGRGAAAPLVDGGGHGLIGMRERAEVCGGHLTAGPRPGGGYAVRARLPLAAPVTA